MSKLPNDFDYLNECAILLKQALTGMNLTGERGRRLLMSE
jgi:hypothetical protein